jgi:hypothetical protein
MGCNEKGPYFNKCQYYCDNNQNYDIFAKETKKKMLFSGPLRLLYYKIEYSV